MTFCGINFIVHASNFFFRMQRNGTGKRYYQASFYGGRVSEMLDLATWCAESTRADLSDSIMALWCDESYLNKYLLERNPKVIGTIYCKPEEFEGPCKAILRDKNKIFGKENIDRLKQAFINPALSYLRDKELQIKPLYWVERMGRLGNQMFQYAFLLGLKSTNSNNDFRLSDPVVFPGESIHGSDLEQVFDIPAAHLTNEQLTRQIQRTPASCTRLVHERAGSVWQEIDTDWPLLSIYRGYWQTELYFKKIAPAIRKVFRFDAERLNEKSRDIADKIRSCMAISIHIRRGDYLADTKQEIYGNICTLDYYRQAVRLLKECLPKEACYYFLFSDDSVWVKENMPMENAVIVDWNQGAESWQDMYLMSLCRHHIIANSSFSWWGAWLNPHEDKIVIAPYRWYNNMLAPDILPDNWIALHPSGYHKCKMNMSEQMAEDILKTQLAVISRYKSKDQEMPDEYVLANPDMVKVISLYTYARYAEDSWFMDRADGLLDAVIDTAVAEGNEGSAICCLGCSLIYLLRNGFAEGDEDEILEELDTRVSTLCINWNEKEKFSLYACLHYLVLRVEAAEKKATTLVNKQNLIQLLDRLEDIGVIDDCLLNDIRKIDRLGIFPERTKRLLCAKEIVNVNHIEIEKPLDDMVTFVIPVRIDSPERKENLDVVLDRLSKRKQSKIIVLEADNAPKYRVSENYPNVTYRFVEDNNPIFYRTKYLNELLREADTSIVGVWDTDVIVPDDQIDYSIADIQNGKAVMSFPYDGRFNLCSLEDSFVFRNNRLIDFLEEKEYSNRFLHSVGGAFLVHKDYYLEAGGENEHFYGWGMEDMERVKRMEIVGLPVSRASGALYHLFHSRNENSRFYSPRLEEESRKEFLKVCSMCKDQLKHYIRTWKDVAQEYENRVYLPSDMHVRSPFLANYFCLMENYRMAFVVIAKNASSHLRNVFVSSLYGFYPNQAGAHSLVGHNDESPYLCPVSKMQEEEKKFGKMIKFAIWRDPVERLVSCYKHFCLEKTDRFYFHYLALFEDNSFDRFMEFVRFELGKKNPLSQDEHIRRQSDYYRPEDVDYIVPIHKLNQFLEEHGVHVLKKSANETSVKFQLTDRNYIEEIKELYKADYEIEVTY